MTLQLVKQGILLTHPMVGHYPTLVKRNNVLRMLWIEFQPMVLK